MIESFVVYKKSRMMLSRLANYIKELVLYEQYCDV